MPRTNSRKRNSRRNDNTNRVSVASNLSPNAPEFVPMVNNDSSANQGEYSAVQSMTFSGSSNVPNSTGNYSNSNNSESSSTIVSTADPLENKGQRDLLINLLNTSQVDCVICYERTQNVEHIWNCRNCFQIMHLKCVMVWFIKSHNNAVWRCPACQNPLTGKPKYVCFCGALSNPFSNNVDTPHSCGQVCSLRKINTNADYDDCQHTCTLLCHPGPCPQCVVHVLRKCGCGKTSVYVQCGQSKPILCQNMCSKELECKNHICEKPCHVDKCGPCKMKCPQSIVLMESDSLIERPIAGTHEGRSVPIFEVLRREIMQVPNWRNPILNSAFVSAEELLVLGLNPDDYARERNQRRRYLTNDFYDDHESINFDDDEDDDDNEENLDGSARFYACYCGQSQQTVPCTPENAMVVYYSCGKLCGKKLSCENHLCQKQCHMGQCEPCRAIDIFRCPCGKRSLTQDEISNRKLCTEPVPTCDKLCGKPLGCGPPENPHLCEESCHEGPCSRCELKTKYLCKCGNRSREIKCNSLTSELTCKKKCHKMMSCGKHRCMVICCDAQVHECNRICNGLLNCRQHRCDRVCHTGSCNICYEASFEELYCRCGNTFIVPPVRCGTPLPRCTFRCSREHECDHPAEHACHNREQCPPCIVLTEKLCYGGHELRFAIPCHIKNVSCGMPCGYPLPCSRHTCDKPCHAPPCNTGPCRLPCNLPKSDCGHPCSKPCHDGPCPQTACKIMVNVSCICGNLTGARICSDPEVIEYRLQVKIQSINLQLDNIVDSTQIIKSYKIMECSTECAKLERNRRIALALQIRNPDLSLNIIPRYSDFMKEFVKKDAPFCNYIHEKLAELVTNAKESKQNSRSHSFEVMKYEKRKLVHEYCEHFGCESVAYDAEPNRNVVATAFKEKSWLPNYSVVEVVQREGGCLRFNPFASIQKRNTMFLNKKF